MTSNLTKIVTACESFYVHMYTVYLGCYGVVHEEGTKWRCSRCLKHKLEAVSYLDFIVDCILNFTNY